MASISVIHGFPLAADLQTYKGDALSIPPTSGTYWATLLSATARSIIEEPTDFDFTPGSSVPTARSWWCWEHAVSSPADSRHQDEEFHIFGTPTWEIRGQMEDADPPTTYKVRLYHTTDGLLGEGSTDFALGAATWRQCRFTWLSGQVALEVDGTYEVNMSTPRPIPPYAIGFRIGGGTGGLSGTNLFLRKLLIVRGDSSSDRPDETTQLYQACQIDSGQDGSYTGWANVGADTWDSDCYDDWDVETVTDTSIAFVDGGGGADTITDSNSGFGVFTANDKINVSGSASNNGDYTIVSVVAGTITLATGTLTAEGAGATVTIQSGHSTDDDTTYIYPPATSTSKETAILDTQPTITANYEHALWVHHKCRITGSPGGAKSLGQSLIHDGSSDGTAGMGTSADANYRIRSGMFKFAPDGGTWVAADAAALEIGVQGEATAVPTGVLHTAIWGEWCKYALDAGDPPPFPSPPGRHISVTHG